MNRSTSKDTNPKDAVGIRKPSLSTLPLPPLFEAALAMLEGALKYGRHNYREAGIRSSVYFDAAMRHLARWWEGEDIDPDSGLPHITKAIATLLVLRDAQMLGKVAFDDRPPSSTDNWLPGMQPHVERLLGLYPDPKPPFVKKDLL
jgi:dATP/dGTP diphosphohydrolase